MPQPSDRHKEKEGDRHPGLTDPDPSNWLAFSPTPALILDPKGRIVAHNALALELLQTPPETLTGQLLSTHIVPAFKNRLGLFLTQTVDTGHSHNTELMLHHSDGTKTFVRLEGALRPDSRSRRSYVWCVLLDLTQRQRMEAETSLQRDNLLTMLNSMPVGVSIINPDYKIRYINPVLKKDFGPVEGRTCYDYFNRKNIPCSHCRLKAVTGGKTFHREWYSKRTGKTYDMMETPLKAVDGSMLKLDILRDISSQKKIENALKWELRIRAVLSELYEPLVAPHTSLEIISQAILDFAMGLTESSHGFVASIDSRSGEQRGHTLTAISPNDCNVKNTNLFHFSIGPDGTYPALWGHALNTKKPLVANHPGSHPACRGVPQGHFQIERLLCIPVLHGDELVGQIALANKKTDYDNTDVDAIRRIARYYGLAIQWQDAADKIQRVNQELEIRVAERTSALEKANVQLRRQIAERHQAQEALRESEQKYSTLVEDALIGVYIVQDGRITFANQKLADIHGYSREELQNMRSLLLVHPEDRELVRSTRSKRLKGESVPTEYETRGITKDGQTIWVLRRNTIVNYKGRPAISSNIVDITHRKQVEEALRESDKELRLLSAQLLSAEENERKRIARELHDSIGQSLSAIKFTVENVLRAIPPTSEIAEITALKTLIPLIQETIEEVRRIVMALRPSILDDLGILATVTWVCREFQTLFQSIRITTTIEVEESHIPQHLKTVIYRVLQEALNNVSKHSGADQVRLNLKPKGTMIEFSITDNGRGFDAKKTLAQISARGGFGLVSMRERISMSGARFTIESAPGSGTCIKMIWPAEKLPKTGPSNAYG